MSIFNYNLAKLLAKKLDYLRENDSIITNTFKFVDELHLLKLDNTHTKMVSFDITSLFTKVPLHRTIEIILDKLYGPKHICIWSKIKRINWCITCNNRFEINYLLEISTKHTNFIFNNRIYSHIDGIQMSLPLGPLFVGIYVNYLEKPLMPSLQKNGVLFWGRFVDDTFVIINHNTNVNKILDILNSVDNNIVFTYEEEKNNSLSFLDIQITRLHTNNIANNSKIFTTTVHRKSTYTGLITKWHSFVPRSYKISTISNMIYRAIKICSTYELMHDEFTFIENTCIENGYPKNFIKPQIRKTLGRYIDRRNGIKHHTPKKETKFNR